MTSTEFAYATMLVSSLMTRLGHANALTAAVKLERDDLAKQLAAHVESLKQSNAQCAEYLRQNEKLRAELETARVAAASLERIQATAAKWGASGQEDAGHFIERTATDLEFMHLQLVEVRSELASVSAERDSLKRTLKEWEEAETKPQQRIPQVGFIQDDDAYFGVKLSVYGNDKKRNRKPAADIADHVVPPVVPMPAESIPLCMTCHECECELRINNHGAPGCFCGDCERMSQTVKNIAYWAVHSHPYYGPCPSKTKVRHE